MAQLDGEDCSPAVNLRPVADWPDTAQVVVTVDRVRAVLERVAADLDELARARRVEDLQSAVLPDARAELRRRLAVPDLGSREFCAERKLPMSSQLQLCRAWDAWHDERYRRGEIGSRPRWQDNPYRPR